MHYQTGKTDGTAAVVQHKSAWNASAIQRDRVGNAHSESLGHIS